MKNSRILILLFTVFVTVTSCEKPKEAQPQDLLLKDVVEGQRYDLKMIKNSEGTLFGVYLDKFDGSVYMWKGSSVASRVSIGNMELDSYAFPAYSINVTLNDKDNPDIYLFDGVTTALYHFSLGNMGSFKEVKVDLK